MKLPTVFITLLLSTLCVLSAEKNELKVKINHVFKTGTGLNSFDGKLQFNYNTSEILQITNRPENFSHGIFLRRNEVDKFKKFLDKMLKFADAVYENEITGVKKDFDDRSLWTSLSRGGYVDRGEDANTKRKSNIRIVFWFNTDGISADSSSWKMQELEELTKVFDDRQKEVFKKYDILKALND